MDVTIVKFSRHRRVQRVILPRDTVSDLAAALLRITQAQTSVVVSWNQEPDQMLLEFSRVGGLVELRVDGVDDSQRSKRSTLLAHQGSVTETVRPFVHALSGLEAVVSDSAYESGWHYPFPHDAVERLRTHAAE